MADIQKELNDIKNAVYGREVRGAIHDGIKKINDEVVNATDLSESAKHQVENIQQQVNQLVVEGDSSVEAAQARVDADGNTFTTLKERLDTKETLFASQLAQIAVNVKTFGAKGDGVTDDIDAISNALEYALTNKRRLYFPKGVYYISEPIKISNDLVSGWKIFEAFGELSGSAVSASESYGNNGTIILTKGTNAVEVEFYDYFNESVKFRDISFVNEEEKENTTGIHVKFNQTSYARKHLFENCNFVGYENAMKFSGYNTDFINNFFGTTLVEFCHTYGCSNAIHFDNVFANLFTITNSLFHGGGVRFSNNAGGYPIIRNSHIEGAEPSCFVIDSATHIKLVLDGFSAESSGRISGYGVISGLERANLELFVSNQNYPFALMPTVYNLPRNSRVNATSQISVAGEGIIVNTPETVQMVTSDVQAFSLFLTNFKNGEMKYGGTKIFKNMAGHNMNVGRSPNSKQLPDNIKSTVVGVTNDTIISNLDESFIAPEDGYIYITWVGKRNDINNGFNSVNIMINEETLPIPVGYRWLPWEGVYTLAIPIQKNDEIKRLMITLYSNEYKTPAFVSFSPKPLFADSFNGFPRKLKRMVTIPAGSTYKLEEVTALDEPYAVRVHLLFDGGSKGFYQFIASGNGSNGTRRMSTIVSNVREGISITDEQFMFHTHMYCKNITNFSQNDIDMEIEIEYLS